MNHYFVLSVLVSTCLVLFPTTIFAQTDDSIKKLEIFGIPEREPDFDGWYNMPFQIIWDMQNISQNGITCDNPSNYIGPSGSNLELQGSCSDVLNNTGTGTFAFKYDSIKPKINPLRNIVEYSEDEQGKIIYYHFPDAADDLGGVMDVTCNPSSGEIFEIKTTPITCNATDAAGNVASTNFSVTIKLLDDVPPIIVIFNDELIQKTTNPKGTAIDYPLPPVKDNVGVTRYHCTPSPQSHFTVGFNNILCIAEDASGNKTIKNFTINLQLVDVVSLFVQEPENIVRTIITNETTIEYSLPIPEEGIKMKDISCEPPPGSIFGIGDHKIDCVAKDMAGNIDTVSFTATVNFVDTEPPTFSIADTIIVKSIKSEGMPVIYSLPDVQDNDKIESVTCNPPSGSIFQTGISRINCVAKDVSGNEKEDSFEIDVRLLVKEGQKINMQTQNDNNQKTKDIPDNTDKSSDKLSYKIVKAQDISKLSGSELMHNDDFKNIQSLKFESWMSIMAGFIVAGLLTFVLIKYVHAKKKSSIRLRVKLKLNSSEITVLDEDEPQ